jgi:hypothetical protein
MRDALPPDVVLHQIAQSMCHARHGDLRYDPGNPKHDKWLDRAKAFASVAGIKCQYGFVPDSNGEVYKVRMVGGWVNA